ncbi:hypothetical protein C4D60_Mb04t35160 [Musa balbisiana]|uniref:Uncharacterized protein n=1 Tax=Musa balbisiana TaxID=52838 RepID=A0A4S8KH07_MUSBA|nr:hypothetical protein C4D60_Mb04t35160 [Musa balbisiana]
MTPHFLLHQPKGLPPVSNFKKWYRRLPREFICKEATVFCENGLVNAHLDGNSLFPEQNNLQITGLRLTKAHRNFLNCRRGATPKPFRSYSDGNISGFHLTSLPKLSDSKIKRFILENLKGVSSSRKQGIINWRSKTFRSENEGRLGSKGRIHRTNHFTSLSFFRHPTPPFLHIACSVSGILMMGSSSNVKHGGNHRSQHEHDKDNTQSIQKIAKNIHAWERMILVNQKNEAGNHNKIKYGTLWYRAAAVEMMASWPSSYQMILPKEKGVKAVKAKEGRTFHLHMDLGHRCLQSAKMIRTLDNRHVKMLDEEEEEEEEL